MSEDRNSDIDHPIIRSALNKIAAGDAYGLRITQEEYDVLRLFVVQHLAIEKGQRELGVDRDEGITTLRVSLDEIRHIRYEMSGREYQPPEYPGRRPEAELDASISRKLNQAEDNLLRMQRTIRVKNLNELDTINAQALPQLMQASPETLALRDAVYEQHRQALERGDLVEAARLQRELVFRVEHAPQRGFAHARQEPHLVPREVKRGHIEGVPVVVAPGNAPFHTRWASYVKQLLTRNHSLPPWSSQSLPLAGPGEQPQQIAEPEARRPQLKM